MVSRFTDINYGALQILSCIIFVDKFMNVKIELEK
jgi:hypothetical protein